MIKLKETLKQIDANIKATKDLISMYEGKQAEIKASEVKNSHVYTCTALGCSLAMLNVGEPAFDLILLAGVGGAFLGAMVPYAVKKVRIADLDFQILVNNSIISDLNKKRERKEAEIKHIKSKKMHFKN